MNETPMGASPQGGKRAGRKASMSALAKRAVIDSFANSTVSHSTADTAKMNPG